MKKSILVSFAMMILIAVPCLAFDFPGHEGQIPMCQNNKTGELKFAPTKDINPPTGVNYEPYCNTKPISDTTTPTETLIWINIQGVQGPAGPQGSAGPQGPQGQQGPAGPQGPEAVYGKMAVVAQSGGDYTDPVAAMNDLSTWCGTPSATNPCLLKIMPGVYDIGTTSLQMQSYVDIEGSGEKNTILTGAIDSGISGVVIGADNAELRFLTVRNTGGGAFVIGMRNYYASPIITNVTVRAYGGVSSTVGIYNLGGNPKLTNVTSNSETSVAGAVSSYCIGILNNDSSPIMTNVEASASGNATYNHGINNHIQSTKPVTNNVRAIASGGYYAVGVYNYAASPEITNLTAVATNGTINIGIMDYYSFTSPSMFNVVSSASGGTSNYGFYSDNLPSSGNVVKIDNSVMSGSTNVIYNSTGVSLYIANTKLDGGPVFNTGNIKCVGTYDGNYNALNSTCQ